MIHNTSFMEFRVFEVFNVVILLFFGFRRFLMLQNDGFNEMLLTLDY